MKNELLFAAKLFVSKILPNEAVLPIVMILLELNFLSFSFFQGLPPRATVHPMRVSPLI